MIDNLLFVTFLLARRVQEEDDEDMKELAAWAS